MRKFQLAYSVFCTAALILNAAVSFRLDALYSILTINATGVLMMAQLIYLLYLALSYARKGNSDAILFTGGFSIFAVVSVAELLRYFISMERYHLYWWKWGMVVFILSLIAILGKRFAEAMRRRWNTPGSWRSSIMSCSVRRKWRLSVSWPPR